MFDLDKWQEIFMTMKHNKLRAILTGFSVAWGIFMLIILLGSGTGLENGVKNQFRGNAMNTMYLWTGEMSKPFEGYKAGRTISMTNEDPIAIKRENKKIAKISSRFRIWGDNTVAYGKFTGNYELNNVNPDVAYIEPVTILQGRHLNQIDMRDMRKVVVIGKDVYNELFKGKPALGEYIRVSTVPFQVVGVFESKQERENRKVYMPILTSQMVFNKVNHIEDVAMLFDASANVEQSKDVEQNIKNQMAKRHHYAVDDGRALYTYNVFNEFNQMQSLFASIRLFVWIIGIGTIIAGIVGVSNIMLIVVRERTREIGIRKAIGASPASIVSQVIAEAVLITSIAGYVGLVLGVLLLEGLKPVFSKSQGMFQNPEVNFTVAISATILLIISGTLAGLIPAVRAASVKPIEALKEE